MISQGPEIELEDSKVLFSVISSIFDIHLFSLTVLSIEQSFLDLLVLPIAGTPVDGVQLGQRTLPLPVTSI